MEQIQILDEAPGSPDFADFAKELHHSARSLLDQELAELQAKKAEWVELNLDEKITILDETLHDLQGVKRSWVEISMEAKDLIPGTFGEGEEWFMLAVLFRSVRLLRESLADIRDHGNTRIPGAIGQRPDGQLVVRVYPKGMMDRLATPGITGEVWLKPERSGEEALARAGFYHRRNPEGRVTLVLGAGNVSVLGPADFLYKLFVEGHVVLLKMSPVTEYLTPLMEQGFRSLISRGYLHMVYGGIEEGVYLTQHPDVDELHMTGSDKTYESIVFGRGLEGSRRKAERQPRNSRRFTAELGNVTPVIVVPGPWSEKDIRSQAAKVGSWLSYNAGFNCVTPRVIIQWKDWVHRKPLTRAIGDYLGRVDTRQAYYPGAHEVHDRYLQVHRDARLIGDPKEDHLPWTVIEDLDPDNKHDPCFQNEAFCSLIAETALEAEDAVEFLRRAVEFANDSLWGTLTATIIVHPSSLRDPVMADAIDEATARLRYGTVAVNQNGFIGYYMAVTPWGGYPNDDIYDIQSGHGFINNVLMFDHPQRAVVRAPFRQIPDPFVATARQVHTYSRHMAAMQAEPSLRALLPVYWAALRS